VLSRAQFEAQRPRKPADPVAELEAAIEEVGNHRGEMREVIREKSPRRDQGVVEAAVEASVKAVKDARVEAAEAKWSGASKQAVASPRASLSLSAHLHRMCSKIHATIAAIEHVQMDIST
jgi:hypothetical protein